MYIYRIYIYIYHTRKIQVELIFNSLYLKLEYILNSFILPIPTHASGLTRAELCNDKSYVMISSRERISLIFDNHAM